MLTRYLKVEGDDKELELRVLACLDRLSVNPDFQFVKENCLMPSAAGAMNTVVEMNYDDVQIPAYQGVARVLGQLMQISESARDHIERRTKGVPTR